MKRNLFIMLAAGILVVAVVAYIIVGGGTRKKLTGDEPPTLRVAWMTSWATAGQIMEALIHTDITERNGVEVEFKSFLFGPPMNEAALTGGVDTTIVGDMPAISLLAASDNWSVVSRTIYFPYALMVRSDIEVNSIEQLRGKTVGVPFGSGPQPTLYRWLEEAGLKIGKTVDVINLLPNEMAEAIRARRVDAIMAWEPTMTILEKSGEVKTLRNAKGVGFMCMSNDFLEKYPDAARRFVESWKEALFYTAHHRKQTDEWFSKDSRFPIDLLARIRIVDDNFSAATLENVDTYLTEEDIAKNQFKADFAFQQKLIGRRLDISDRVIQQFGRAADDEK